MSGDPGNADEKPGDPAQATRCMEVQLDFEKEINHPDYEKHFRKVEEMRPRLKKRQEGTAS